MGVSQAAESLGEPAAAVRSLRVLTWNVHDLLGDPLAVQSVLRAAAPDVACLQEVSRWPGSRRRTAQLARSAGMFFTCGARASAGTALLTSLRVEVRRAAAGRLPVQGWRTRPRGWAHAVVRLPGSVCVEVASLHLGLSPGERRDHVCRILAARLDPTVPLVAAGDLNEAPGGPSWAVLLDELRDPGEAGPPTFPASCPRRRIDAVLVDQGLQVSSYGYPTGVDEADVLAASDHRPVLAEIALPSSG
jgi:endonuclease/exonuclease/phosphatase family metal-dependent hydrolase